MNDPIKIGLFRPFLALLLVSALAACQTTPYLPPGAGETYTHTYQKLDHYRAFAVADTTHAWALGWSFKDPTVRSAMNRAETNCNGIKKQVAAHFCTIYAVGDLIIADMPPEKQKQAIAFYERNKSATNESFEAYLKSQGEKAAAN